MADLSPDAQRAFETLAQLYPELEGLLRTTKLMNKEWASQFKWDLENWPKEKEALEKHIKQIKLVSGPDGMTKFANALKGNSAHLDQYRQQLEHLDQAIEDLGNTTDDATAGSRKQQLEQIREQMAMKIAGAQFRADMLKSGNVLATSLTNTVTRSVGQFTKGLQSDASATELSNTIMNGAVDAATAGVNALGQGVSGVGSILQNSTNRKLQALGSVAGVAGDMIGMAGEAAGKLAKFGIEVLSKEVERTVKAFNDTTTAGALFADGMLGMRTASAAAGLTTDQFANVVKNNSNSLAASGLGVTAGAKAIGNAMKMGGEGAKRELLNLGYSFEEQAGLYAETAANMRRTAGGKSSDAAVAEQTQKYAENLRLIAAITGEDAKKKTEEARQQNQVLAFQQQLAGKSAEQRAQIDAAMATMTEQEKKNFRDRVVLGTVVNKEGAIYEATVAGAREKSEAALALMNNNALTAESNARLNAQYGEQIKNSIMSNKDLAVAGMVAGGTLGEVTRSQLDAVNQANTQTKEAVEEAKKNVQGQKEAADALTKGVTDAAIAAQNFKVGLQTALLPAVMDFARISGEMLTQMQKMVADALGTEGPGEESIWDKTKRIGGAAISGAGDGASVGALYGGTLGTAVAPLAGTAAGGLSGAAIGAILGGLTGAITEAFSDKPGKALGGISSGPRSGYLEKLHGTEAVVPLSNGRSIPVDLKGMGSMAEDMALQTGLVMKDMVLQSGLAGGALLGASETTDTLSSGSSMPIEINGMVSALKDIASQTGSALKDMVLQTGLMADPTSLSIKRDSGMASGLTSSSIKSDSDSMVREQISLLREIKEVLAGSKDLQQQYVYNTYS